MTDSASTAYRRHAIVIGGSIAGLTTARILTDHFDEVTIIDRDHFPETPDPRNGVPQGRHIHILLVQGYRILEQLFPGLGADLAASGATLMSGWLALLGVRRLGDWARASLERLADRAVEYCDLAHPGSDCCRA
jgi:glycine/D-amino acid oxidase-like deaminating enzyme